MAFRKAYEAFEKEAQPSGTKVVYEHREEFDLKGKRRLVKDVPVAIYEKIQASAEQCDIQNIIRRATEGDTSLLNAVNGQYLDITDAPSSLAEAQKMIIRAKEDFEKLDKDIKKKFDYSAEKYVAEIGSESWLEKTGIKEIKEKKAAQEKFEKEFKETYQKAIKNLAKENKANE